MPIINYQPKHFEDWTSMTLLLLTDYDKEELTPKLRRIENSPKHQTFMAVIDEEVVGYATASIRTDYVEGCNASPVGYMEMLFVQEPFRKKGIAKELYQTVESWSAEKGCTEIAADTWEWNKASREFHKQLGFREAEILVHFIKDIDPKRMP